MPSTAPHISPADTYLLRDPDTRKIVSTHSSLDAARRAQSTLGRERTRIERTDRQPLSPAELHALTPKRMGRPLSKTPIITRRVAVAIDHEVTIPLRQLALDLDTTEPNALRQILLHHFGFPSKLGVFKD